MVEEEQLSDFSMNDYIDDGEWPVIYPKAFLIEVQRLAAVKIMYLYVCAFCLVL